MKEKTTVVTPLSGLSCYSASVEMEITDCLADVTIITDADATLSSSFCYFPAAVATMAYSADAANYLL